MKREVLLVESHDTVPENGPVAVIGSIREKNVVSNVTTRFFRWSIA